MTVGPLFTNTTSLKVGLWNAIATPKPKVGKHQIVLFKMLFSGGGVLSVQHLLVGITSNGAFSYCYESANSRWQKQ